MKAKCKFLGVLLAVCMVFGIAPTAIFATDNIPDSVWTDYATTEFAGGTGTEADPYQIATSEQLAKISKDVSEGIDYQGTFFKLTENIDLSSHRWIPIGISKWGSEEPVINKSFQGFIDGDNKTISGLIVDERTDKNTAGFFGNIRNPRGGTVGAKNLIISNANIYADENGLNILNAGILAGFAMANPDQQVIFENITVSGTIEINSTNGNQKVGGMLGDGTRVKATDCKAENISITGATNSGGFVGVDNGSVYQNCKASGTISGGWALGGFVGYTTSSTYQDSTTQSIFEKCAADVEIEGFDWNLGGFAGYAEYGKFDNCVAFGNITSTVDSWEPNVGGFIGKSDNAVTTNCHTTGIVTANSTTYEAGGFVGNCVGGTFEGCSFDSERNSDLTAAGIGSISSGVEGSNYNEVLGNICEDYYEAHTYSIEWTIDTAATCTADGSKSQHCKHCDTKGNITVITATGHSMQKVERVEPTCTTTGKEAYYSCNACGKHFEDENGTSEIADLESYGVIAAIGHTFGEPSFVWADDGKSCSATLTCTNNVNHVEEIMATITSEVKTAATCTEMGVTTYTATVTVEDQKYSDTKDAADIPYAEHTLSRTERAEATCITTGKEAYYTCNACGKHFEDENGTSEIADLESYGVIAVTGHTFGEPSFVWADDGKSCKGVVTCTNDVNHVEEITASITSEVKTAATCTEMGVTTYTATVTVNDQDYSSTKDVADIPMLEHNAVKTEAKAPTATEPGNIAYWHCEDCGKYFRDQALTEEISQAQTVLAATGGGSNPGSGNNTSGSTETDSSNTGDAAGATDTDSNTDSQAGSIGTNTTGTANSGTDHNAAGSTSTDSSNTGSATSNSTTPKTEDNNNLILWIVILLVSGAGLIGIVSYRQKKQHS